MRLAVIAITLVVIATMLDVIGDHIIAIERDLRAANVARGIK